MQKYDIKLWKNSLTVKWFTKTCGYERTSNNLSSDKFLITNLYFKKMFLILENTLRKTLSNWDAENMVLNFKQWHYKTIPQK